MPVRSFPYSRYQEPPEWAKELQRGVFLLTQRVDSLGPKIDSIKQQGMSPIDERQYYMGEQAPSEMYTQTPLTQTVNIQTHPTGTIGDESMFQPATDIHIAESTHGQTLPGSMHRHDGSTHGLTEQEEYEDEETENGRGYGQTSTQGDTHNRGLSEYTGNRDSPGQQFLEEELYKLRVRAGPGSQSGNTHKTWELARDNGDYEDEDPDQQAAVTESGAQETNPSGYGDRRPLHPICLPYLLMMVLVMCLQVRFGNSNLQATITASRHSYFRGSASTNACSIGLSSGLSPSLTTHSIARHAETKLTKLPSAFGQRRRTSDMFAAR